MSEIYGSSGLQVLSNVLGSSSLMLLLQFNIKLCQNLPSEVKYSREAASLKMVNFSVEEEKNIQSKTKTSAARPRWNCQAVLSSASLWPKSLIIVMVKLLMLYQREVCTTIHKQHGDDMAFHKQQKDTMVIYRWQLHKIVSFQLFYSNELCRQQQFMAVFLVKFLAQHFTFIHHHFEALKSLVFSLTECRHFQGS